MRERSRESSTEYATAWQNHGDDPGARLNLAGSAGAAAGGEALFAETAQVGSERVQDGAGGRVGDEILHFLGVHLQIVQLVHAFEAGVLD